MPTNSNVGRMPGANINRYVRSEVGPLTLTADAVDVALSATAGRSFAAPIVAALLGFLLVLGVGFAGSQYLHNAAHDSRHSFSFPCH